MPGYGFFEEYRTTSLERSAGNVIAVPLPSDFILQEGSICVQAICNDGDTIAPNSPVAPALLKGEFLGRNCRPISEDRARSIHPRLFEYLEQLA